MTTDTSMKFRGSGVAMVTPFKANGDVDGDRLSQHTDILIEAGINYLVVLGTTAETPTLSASEKSDVVRTVVQAAGGRVPIMVGAGGNSTKDVADTILQMDKSGVDALLSVVPYYNKPSQEGIYQHYSALAAGSELPILLYNVPSRTGTHMQAQTILRLAHDYPQGIMGVKEASGSFEHMSAILKDKPESFMLISGDDVLTQPMLALGASGVISVVGNAYPELMSALVHAGLEGKMEESRKIHLQLFPMMQAIFKEGNPAGVKAAMELRGWLGNVLRLPLIPASARLQEEIRQLNTALVH